LLELQYKRGRYYYSILNNPVARVMKFDQFSIYCSALPDGECILDYGAGDRPLEPLLRTKFNNYIAADYPPSNKAHTRRPDIQIHDDGTVDLAAESVDCVIMTEVLEHIYEPKRTLSEIHRILKPGGAIIGTVPFAIGEHEQPYDFHRYTSFCLHRMFEETGFQVVDVDYIGDGVGVAVSNFCKVFGIITKALYKLKLAPLAKVAGFIIGLPGIIYYVAVKAGIDPRRIKYYRNNPLGFTFYVIKK